MGVVVGATSAASMTTTRVRAVITKSLVADKAHIRSDQTQTRIETTIEVSEADRKTVTEEVDNDGLTIEVDAGMGVAVFITMMSVKLTMEIISELWRADGCSCRTWHLRLNGST